MKQFFSLFTFAAMVLSFVACTADYDEFEASHYKAFKNIVFEEQDGDASVSEEEHIIKVTTVAPPESLETWDSLTIESISASNLATLHLVDGKFKEFPSDSAALDSLANEVSYVKKNLKAGSKIRIPKSQVIYVMLVAENGDPAIWKIEITIPGVEQEEPSSDSKDEKSSSSVKNAKSSSSSAKAESSSSSEKALKTETDLQLTFKNQFKVGHAGDTISIKLASDQKIEDATVNSYKISDGASISPDPEKIEDWSNAQEIVVTAEDGKTKQTWIVVVDIAAEDEKPASTEKELVSISAKNEIADATIDTENKTVVVHLQKQKEIVSVELAIEVSESASQNLKAEALDLREPVTMTIMAEDGSTVEWTISADFEEAAVAPRITAMKIAGNDAVIDSIEENGEWFRWIHFDNLKFMTDLSKLEVSGIELSEDASVEELENGESYDLTSKWVTVSNGFVSERYEIRAGYQYQNSDFNTWVSDAFGGTNDVDGWDNGNNDAATAGKTLTVNENKSVVKMVTKNIVGKIASGNMFVGYFNPKKVPALLGSDNLLKYEDGNELIDFGRPFKARPRYVEFDVKYAGAGDSCDLYVVLENRTSTSNDGKNQYRSGAENTMVASAWYRATTVDSEDDPDVVSISPASREGYTTIRMKLKYGTPFAGSPIENSSTFNSTLKNKNGIDNHLVKTDKPEDFAVTHIRIAMASSAMGNYYKGTVGAALYADEIRFSY
ncbi:MAG: PCMD domain-containing protein [Fibrobacter sp.]|nr:PCMD domain-containing protein [Fibrobacter sp.]